MMPEKFPQVILRNGKVDQASYTGFDCTRKIMNQENKDLGEVNAATR